MGAKIKVLCLSGWANKSNSLEPSLKNFADFEILSFDYLNFSSIGQLFLAAKDLNFKPDLVIGWSLGGQIACRLMAQKIFNPQLLIIIASSFQFVESKAVPYGMSKINYEVFREVFKTFPDKTLKKFASLMLVNDDQASFIRSNLDISANNHNGLEFWLDELGRFSGFEIDFDNFPRTILLYGNKDALVNPRQGETYAAFIKNSRLEIFKNCGHCPHLNDPARFELIIKEELKTLT